MFQSALAPRVSRTERVGLLLTVALLLFAGISALVTHSTASTPSAAAARPVDGLAVAVPGDRLTALRRLPARERDGRVLVHLSDAGFLRVTTERARPTLLEVAVPHGTSVLDCNLVEPRVAVLGESATAVRLVASGWEYVPAASARGGHGGSTCVQKGTVLVPVRLQAPLGGRAVFSGHSTRAVRVVASGA